MEQNNSTELSGHPFNNIYIENDPPDPHRPQIRNFLDFPGLSIGNQFFSRSTFRLHKECWFLSVLGKTERPLPICYTPYRSGIHVVALWFYNALPAAGKSLLGAFVKHLWGIFMADIIKRIAQKLRRIVLLHFWATSFSISLSENLKTLHFYVLGIFGCAHDS